MIVVQALRDAAPRPLQRLQGDRLVASDDAERDALRGARRHQVELDRADGSDRLGGQALVGLRGEQAEGCLLGAVRCRVGLGLAAGRERTREDRPAVRPERDRRRRQTCAGGDRLRRGTGRPGLRLVEHQRARDRRADRAQRVREGLGERVDRRAGQLGHGPRRVGVADGPPVDVEEDEAPIEPVTEPVELGPDVGPALLPARPAPHLGHDVLVGAGVPVDLDGVPAGDRRRDDPRRARDREGDDDDADREEADEQATTHEDPSPRSRRSGTRRRRRSRCRRAPPGRARASP